MALPDGSAWGRSEAPRRKRSWFTLGRVLIVIGVGLLVVLAYIFLGRESVSERPNEMKTTQVILPPPPPPPPPEPQEVEQPPEPTVAPPIEQPMDTPPPPDSSSDPTPGDNALTAREGAGPSNYGLGRGDGGGVRIGGRPGGEGRGGGMSVGMYTTYLRSALQERVQDDSRLARLIFSAEFSLTITSDGRVSGVRLRDARGASDSDMEKLSALLAQVRGLDPPPAAMTFPQLVTVRGRRSSF